VSWTGLDASIWGRLFFVLVCRVVDAGSPAGVTNGHLLKCVHVCVCVCVCVCSCSCLCLCLCLCSCLCLCLCSCLCLCVPACLHACVRSFGGASSSVAPPPNCPRSPAAARAAAAASTATSTLFGACKKGKAGGRGGWRPPGGTPVVPMGCPRGTLGVSPGPPWGNPQESPEVLPAYNAKMQAMETMTHHLNPMTN
jgi:hypothetical protein